MKPHDENALNKWIDSVREIHTSAPAPSVQYSGPVPDIEKLMEAWPTELQACSLQEITLVLQVVSL